jgi:hypothetical protein
VDLSKPVDPKKDQVEETPRVLREMWDKADRAIDEQSAQLRPRRQPMSAFGGKADMPFCTANVR